MTWRALREEIAAEFRELAPSPWDAIEMLQRTRDEAARQADDRAATLRRISVLHAMGRTHEARVLESRVRGAMKRKLKAKGKAKHARKNA